MLTSTSSSSRSLASSSQARAYRSPKSLAQPRSHPSPQPSTAVRQGASVPSLASISQQPAAAAAAAAAAAPAAQPTKARTADAGTQYTPPDWPPTDPRSSINTRKVTACGAHTSSSTSARGTTTTTPPPTIATTAPPHPPAQDHATAPAPPATPTLPAEPPTRITPSSSLQNVASAARNRPRSPPSTTSHTSTFHNPREPAAAPSKRSKPSADLVPPTVLPSAYESCDAKALARIIAAMLMRLITHNDSIPLKDGQLTRFHSRTPPAISVHDYLQRLTFHATLLPPILLSMVFFIDRLSAHFPSFIINSLTVHRFLITAATVASKGLSDSFWTNSTYARVGGVSVKELALLELELLLKADWRIIPTDEELKGYYRGLVDGCEGFVIEGLEGVEMETETNGDGDVDVDEDRKMNGGDERGRSREADSEASSGVKREFSSSGSDDSMGF